MNNDEDVVRLRGIGTMWNVLSDHDLPVRLMPQSLVIDPDRGVNLQFLHLEVGVFASTREGTLTLYEGRKGLAWEARLPWTMRTNALLRPLRLGEFQMCSLGFAVAESRHSGESLDVDLAVLHEVSLVDRGAVPGTWAWVENEPLSYTRAEIDAARGTWQRISHNATIADATAERAVMNSGLRILGADHPTARNASPAPARTSRPSSCSTPKIKSSRSTRSRPGARPPAMVLAGIDRILAMGRPRGYTGGIAINGLEKRHAS